MTHATRFVAVVAILAALALCVPVQAQTPEIDALRARAEAGDAVAQFDVGFSYGTGRGVPEDHAEAVRRYRLAADQGFAEALYNLGVMYANGLGVPEDDAEAVRWYRLAADQGHASGQNILGVMYVDGRGVTQDYVLAHMWFNLAAAGSNGDRHINNRDRAAEELTPDDLSEAQRLAREWDAAHPREP
jgi:TPR repeat protein